VCHLSDIAARLGRKLIFDPKKETFVKDKEADQRLALKPILGRLAHRPAKVALAARD
jgi:hypothetical protein